MSVAINLYQSTSDNIINRDSLLIAHQGLVRRVAYHLRSRIPNFIEIDDLIQVGMMGLMEASESFDPSMGIAFEAFAILRVRGAMLDEVRKISVLPRSAVTFHREVSVATQTLSSQLGRQPSSGEIANYLGIDIDDFHVEKSHAYSYQFHSIEEVSDEALSIADNKNYQPDLIFESNQIKERLIHLIEALPEREKLIVSLYYVEELNLKEIGAVLDVGESRISQILSSIVKKLRDQINVL